PSPRLRSRKQWGAGTKSPAWRELRARVSSGISPDHLIVERRKRDAARDKMLEFTQNQKVDSVKMHWQKSTDRRIVLGTIKRRVQEAMGQYQMSIDERRERLRVLLEEEDRRHLRELEEGQSNAALEKQLKMHERAQTLRDRRESDRQRVVAEKLEQLFRQQSQELRALEGQRQLDEVCSERAAQIQMQLETRRQREEDERLFAQLWEMDRQAKQDREGRETRRQWENNQEQLAFLRMQVEAAEQQRMQAKQLKEEEAQILQEQREMRCLEEQRGHQQKLQNQENQRRMLDRSLRLKLKRLAHEQQDELALDMSILEQLLSEDSDEKRGEAERRNERREEQSRYRQYLAQQLEQQRREEAEAEQLMESELQQAWARRAEQARLEKEARDRLMKDVLDTRRLQIQEKLDRNMQKQAQLAEDKDELNKVIQENKLLDEEEVKRLREASREYQAELLAQILQRQTLRESEQAEEELEYQKGRAYEELYSKKMQDILSRPTSNTRAAHPFRRKENPSSI
uniref:Cilia- and flagella-associated protein 53 n=1 Tax=Denticeps clupeoides TaxID=299321 RepID=A0AAY4C119_9TELE